MRRKGWTSSQETGSLLLTLRLRRLNLRLLVVLPPALLLILPDSLQAGVPADLIWWDTRVRTHRQNSCTCALKKKL